LPLCKNETQKFTINFNLNKDCMRWLSKSHKFAGLVFAIAAGVFAVGEARGESAYLPSVGSPPLRFQVFNTNRLFLSLKSFAPAKVSELETNLAAAAAIVTNMAATPVSPPNANTNQAPASPPTVADGKNNSEIQGVSTNSSSSAGDLLTVTPQMITEYLKPDQKQADPADQKGAVHFVPEGMQFAPPPPSSPGESRATYKSQ
jgi:hypothetical protein